MCLNIAQRGREQGKLTHFVSILTGWRLPLRTGSVALGGGTCVSVKRAPADIPSDITKEFKAEAKEMCQLLR